MVRGTVPMIYPDIRGTNQRNMINNSNPRVILTNQMTDTTNTKTKPGLNINLQKLSTMSSHEQKQAFGEAVYPLVYEKNAILAGKITGMLLEMNN